MFVDASALVAMLTNEGDAVLLSDSLKDGANAMTSPLAVFETVVAVARILLLDVREAEAGVTDFLEAMEIKILPIPPEAGAIALRAHERFGKGRGHPAQLNMGDCFAYACARHHGVPLLYKGADFAATDIEGA